MRRGGAHVSGGERLVVVGSGMATTRLVEQLVAHGVTRRSRVTVLGEEPHAPYNRILLSAVLEGTHPESALTLRDPGWYADAGVALRLGTRVLSLDTARRDVMLVDGEVVPYDRLVLATGALPTLPPIRGLVRPDGRLHPRVHAFRGLDDCRRLLAALPGARRAVVVGGGLLGLQVTRALAVRGLETELVEGGEHLLRSQVGGPAGAVLARALRRLGTTVYTGTRATRLTDEGLRLDTGFTLGTDLVVLTAGGRPSTALARAAGLEVRRGVVVDEHLRTSDPHVHAVGDCAQHGEVAGGLVPPAWEQAEALAAHLAGTGATYTGSRSVARLRATGLDVAVLGDPERAAAEGGEVVEVTNPVAGTHRRLVVRDGVVVAAAFVGDLTRIGLVTQYFDRAVRLAAHEPGALLVGERTAPPARLADTTEICACAGVSAGAVRGCSSLEEVRATTRATTGCGGCAPAVRELLAGRPALTP